jgi:tRNA pseudouridine65 synthase
VLFARSPEAAKALSESAKDGACRKEYVALVRGEAPATLDIDYPICRREGGPKVDARTLVCRVAIAETAPRHATLVLASPLTGRLHQIRRHLKHENFPLYGDGRYGRGDLNRAFAETYGLRRLALHAIRWRVEDPTSRRVASGHVPMPPDLTEPLRAMGFPLSTLDAAIDEALTRLHPPPHPVDCKEPGDC